MNETELSELKKSVYEISAKITEIGLLLRNHIDLTKEKMENQQKDIKLVSDEVFGGGSKDGLKTTVDRIEQNEKSRSLWLKGIIGSIIGLLVQSFWSIIKQIK